MRSACKSRSCCGTTAEFKVDFKNPTASDALTTKIPKEFLGIQYFKTKKDAERAVARNQERIKK